MLASSKEGKTGESMMYILYYTRNDNEVLGNASNDAPYCIHTQKLKPIRAAKKNARSHAIYREEKPNTCSMYFGPMKSQARPSARRHRGWDQNLGQQAVGPAKNTGI